MLDWTDRHFRYFFRLISKKARLYTEMVTAPAVVFGDQDSLLQFSDQEHPIACQLGGQDPEMMAKAANIVTQYGYDEINLNIGCPSDRVQKGAFGACLMANPQQVAKCYQAIQTRTHLPITIKTRIGIDHEDSLEFLAAFIETLSAVGCSTFIIHARIAWLQGLSPKENRTVPPLNYDRVYQIKALYPHLIIILNGGIIELDTIPEHLKHLDGVMVGRACYQNPYAFATVDQMLDDCNTLPPTRQSILQQYLDYCDEYWQTHSQKGVIKSLSLPLFGLFKGCPGGKHWRRALSQIRHNSQDSQILHDICQPFLSTEPHR